jgi:glyoxylase-like metal-dependent hydrolase (beta-lactamase superfamily II)
MGLPVAADWFAFETVGDGITRIWEPFVHDFMQANVWHIRGRDADLLVDAGMGVADLAGALAARGVTAQRPLLLVLTHCHADHAGGAHQFWPRAVHVAEAGDLAHPGDRRPLVAADYECSEYLVWPESGDVPGAGGSSPARAGAVDQAAAAGLVLSALPAPDFDPSTFTVSPATPTVQVQEGDVLDLGDREFRVLHLPGHSPGSIGLWAEADGLLVCGDVVYDTGVLLDELTGSSIPDYLDSMRRLRDLPVRTVLAGHGAPFGRDLLRERAGGYLETRG